MATRSEKFWGTSPTFFVNYSMSFHKLNIMRRWTDCLIYGFIPSDFSKHIMQCMSNVFVVLSMITILCVSVFCPKLIKKLCLNTALIWNEFSLLFSFIFIDPVLALVGICQLFFVMVLKLFLFSWSVSWFQSWFVSCFYNGLSPLWSLRHTVLKAILFKICFPCWSLFWSVNLQVWSFKNSETCQ